MYRSGNINLRYWLPVFVWLLAIFFFSTDSFSANQSSRFVVPFLTYLFPGLSHDQISFWHGVVRKLSHVAEYFVLGFLAWRAFRQQYGYVAKARLLTAALVLLVASSDEFHQSLTISRSSSFVDVGYDCLGGIAALVLLSNPRHDIRTVHSHTVL